MNPSIFTSILEAYFPEPHASLLNGIIFGVDLRTSKAFYEDLRTVGLLHIVVLSGMNITFLAVIIGAATRWLGKRISIVLTIVCVIGFILFVGPEPPIIRAGIMGVLSLLAIAWGRQNNALYALILSAVAIAIVKPDWVGNISFQLSFAATLGLILFGKPKPIGVIEQATPVQKAMHKLKHLIRAELRISCAAQVFTAPLIFIYFKQISFISPIANVLIAPVIAPLMIIGFVTALLGKIHFALGAGPALIAFGILEYMTAIVKILKNVPGASLTL